MHHRFRQILLQQLIRSLNFLYKALFYTCLFVPSQETAQLVKVYGARISCRRPSNLLDDSKVVGHFLRHRRPPVGLESDEQGIRS